MTPQIIKWPILYRIVAIPQSLAEFTPTAYAAKIAK
jgi:hypothetical protein